MIGMEHKYSIHLIDTDFHRRVHQKVAKLSKIAVGFCIAVHSNLIHLIHTKRLLQGAQKLGLSLIGRHKYHLQGKRFTAKRLPQSGRCRGIDGTDAASACPGDLSGWQAGICSRPGRRRSGYGQTRGCQHHHPGSRRQDTAAISSVWPTGLTNVSCQWMFYRETVPWTQRNLVDKLVVFFL